MPEPVNEDLAEFARLQQQAEDIDAGKSITQLAAGKPTEPVVVEKKQILPEEPEEPNVTELKEEDEEFEETEEPGDKEPAISKEEKDAQRYDRNWKKFQEEKQQLYSRLERLERREKEIAAREAEVQRHAPTESYKDEQGYTATQYEHYAQQCDEKEDYRSAAMARKRAEEVRLKAMQEQFARDYRDDREDVINATEDLQNHLSPLAREVDKLIRSERIWTADPKGFRYAVEYARGRLNSNKIAELTAEKEKLTQEVTRLNGLLGVNGGGTHRSTKAKKFDDMSDEEQFQHLLKQAEELET
jgi:hypothetical protein